MPTTPLLTNAQFIKNFKVIIHLSKLLSILCTERMYRNWTFFRFTHQMHLLWLVQIWISTLGEHPVCRIHIISVVSENFRQKSKQTFCFHLWHMYHLAISSGKKHVTKAQTHEHQTNSARILECKFLSTDNRVATLQIAQKGRYPQMTAQSHLQT